MNILIADDHELIREGIRQSLQELDQHAVIFEAEDEDQVQDILQSEPIDVLLLDLVLPDGKSFKLLESATLEYPEMKIAMLTSFKKATPARLKSHNLIGLQLKLILYLLLFHHQITRR